MGGPFTYIQNVMPIVDTVLYHVILNIFPCKKNMFGCINVTEIRTLRSSSLNAHILGALLL